MSSLGADDDINIIPSSQTQMQNEIFHDTIQETQTSSDDAPEAEIDMESINNTDTACANTYMTSQSQGNWSDILTCGQRARSGSVSTPQPELH